MTTSGRIFAGRAFVRHLYTLTRLVGLYGLDHKQVASTRESAWAELQKALGGEPKIRIVVAGDQLLMDGEFLKAGMAERSLAQTFNRASMAGLSFSAGLDLDEFLKLVQSLARTKPPELLGELQQQFGPEARIRAVEFELREGPASSANSSAPQGNGDLAMAGFLATTLFGAPAGVPQGELNDPHKLLQALCAASGGGMSPVPAPPPGQGSANLQEEEVASVIHWLAALGGKPAANPPHNPEGEEKGEGKSADGSGEQSGDTSGKASDLGGISAVTKNALLESLAGAVEKANQGVQRPLLVTLAEHLAIRVALDKYERGETPYNVVQQTLDGLKKEIAGLRETVKVREDALGRAGVKLDSFDAELDRQFWEAIPARR